VCVCVCFAVYLCFFVCLRASVPLLCKDEVNVLMCQCGLLLLACCFVAACASFVKSVPDIDDAKMMCVTALVLMKVE
jgi:hypothetical protein